MVGRLALPRTEFILVLDWTCYDCALQNAGSSNGRTAGSGPVGLGSNPSPAAKNAVKSEKWRVNSVTCKEDDIQISLFTLHFPLS